MSTDANVQLLERASEMVTYFEGKLPAKLIEKALEENDLEQLHKYVIEAEATASRQEFESTDAY